MTQYLETTGRAYYGILDNECGTLVDRHDNESGDYSYTSKTLIDTDVLVVDNLSIQPGKKALYEEEKDARHIKWLLEQENPGQSYSVVAFREKVYTFYEFEVVE